MWKTDCTSYIRPELVEIVYEHARNDNVTLERFKERWTPDLDKFKDLVLVKTGYKHEKYGEILCNSIYLTKSEYRELDDKNPVFDFFDGEIVISFKEFVRKVVVDPYNIYLSSLL